MSLNRIAIGVSSCLLGHKVRYDGSDKRNSIVGNQICNYFDCRPICPEYAIGLGVPRDPIQLVKLDTGIRALKVADKTIDVTYPLVQYAAYVFNALPQICGYVFKARSPSCGLTDTPIYNQSGDVNAKGRGVYANQICELKNSLPVIDEIQLAILEARQEFIREVERYSRSIQQN